MADGYLISLLFKNNKFPPKTSNVVEALPLDKPLNEQHHDWINDPAYSSRRHCAPENNDTAKTQKPIITEELYEPLETNENHNRLPHKESSSLFLTSNNSFMFQNPPPPGSRLTNSAVCCSTNLSEEPSPPSSAAHTTSEISEKLQSYLQQPEFPSEFFKESNAESQILQQEEQEEFFFHHPSDFSFPSSFKNDNFLPSSESSSYVTNCAPPPQFNDHSIFEPPTELLHYENEIFKRQLSHLNLPITQPATTTGPPPPDPPPNTLSSSQKQLSSEPPKTIIPTNKSKQLNSSSAGLALPKKFQGASSRYLPRAIAAVAAPLRRKFRSHLHQQHPAPTAVLHQQCHLNSQETCREDSLHPSYEADPPIRSFALTVIPCLQGALAVRQNRVPPHKASVFSSSGASDCCVSSKTTGTLLSEVMASEKSMCWLKIVGWGGADMSGKKWLFLTDLLSEKTKATTTGTGTTIENAVCKINKDTKEITKEKTELNEDHSLITQSDQRLGTPSMYLEQDRLIAFSMLVQYIKLSRSIRCISRAFANVVHRMTENLQEDQFLNLSYNHRVTFSTSTLETEKKQQKKQHCTNVTANSSALTQFTGEILCDKKCENSNNNENKNHICDVDKKNTCNSDDKNNSSDDNGFNFPPDMMDLVTTRLLHGEPTATLLKLSSLSYSEQFSTGDNNNNLLGSSSFSENVSTNSSNVVTNSASNKKSVSSNISVTLGTTSGYSSQKQRKQSSIGTCSTAPGSVVISSIASTEEPFVSETQVAIDTAAASKCLLSSDKKFNSNNTKYQSKKSPQKRKWMPCVSACFVEVIIFLQSIMELFHKSKITKEQEVPSSSNPLDDYPSKKASNTSGKQFPPQRQLFSGTAYWIIVLALWLERRLHVVSKKSSNPFLLQTYCCCRVFTLEDIHLTRSMHTKYVSSNKVLSESPGPPVSNENLISFKNKFKKNQANDETPQQERQQAKSENDYHKESLLKNIFKHLEAVQLDKEHDDSGFQLGSQIDTLRRFLVLCFCAWSWIDDRAINSNNLTAILHQAWCCTHAQISFGLLDTTQGKKRASEFSNDIESGGIIGGKMSHGDPGTSEKLRHVPRLSCVLRQGRTAAEATKLQQAAPQQKYDFYTSLQGLGTSQAVTCYYKEYLALPTCCSSMDFEVQVFSFLKKLGYRLNAIPECLKHLSKAWRNLLEEEDCCIRFCESAFNTCADE